MAGGGGLTAACGKPEHLGRGVPPSYGRGCPAQGRGEGIMSQLLPWHPAGRHFSHALWPTAERRTGGLLTFFFSARALSEPGGAAEWRRGRRGDGGLIGVRNGVSSGVSSGVSGVRIGVEGGAGRGGFRRCFLEASRGGPN